MAAIRQNVTWRLVYPRYYCPTRWLGLHQALLSILNCWDLLTIYVGTLQDDHGFRPDRRPYAAEPEEEELRGEDLADASKSGRLGRRCLGSRDNISSVG